MVRAGELQPDFVMIMDADDLVSNQIVQYANVHKESNGWMLKQGYIYEYGSQWINYTEHFSCGSNSIVSSKLIQFPEDLSEQSINNCIILRWGHTIICEKLAELRTPLSPLPFIGAVYILNHGENDSSLCTSSERYWHGVRYFLAKMRRIRPLTRRVKTDFSMHG